MRAGDLYDRITIQTNTPTRDTFGAPIDHWSTLATVWAQVVATAGGEQIAQAAGVVTTIYKITLRYRDDITSAMRVLYGDRILEIRAILSGDEVSSMILNCVEVTR